MKQTSTPRSSGARRPLFALLVAAVQKADLASILTYHVLPAKVGAADVTAESTPATVQGETVDVKPANGGVSVNDATVTAADAAASNGVIHVIDKVLLPAP